MALSIEICRSCVYLVQARVKKTKVVIQKKDCFEFPEEWISDKGITNVEDFSNLLTNKIKSGGFNGKSTNLCINNSSIIYRELMIPRVDEKRLALLVRSEMMSVLNLTPDYVMDYVILEEVVEDDSKFYRILAVAILKDALESYINVLKESKLKIVAIDSATNAVIKLVDGMDIFTDNQQLILADISANHLRLYLFEDGKYALSRNNRLLQYSDDSADDFITAVVENINKMVQFAYTRESGQNAKKIVLSGADDILEAVRSKVDNELMIPCVIIGKPANVEANVKYENRYINAIGTLIRK